MIASLQNADLVETQKNDIIPQQTNRDDVKTTAVQVENEKPAAADVSNKEVDDDDEGKQLFVDKKRSIQYRF